MQDIEVYLAILFKFLAASLVIERILELLDQILSFLGFATGNKKMLISLANKQLNAEQEENRRVIKMLIMQTIGIIAGSVICYSSKLGIARELQFVSGSAPAWWDILLSGILISGGSEPIHSLINFLKEKKEVLKNERKKLEDELDVVELPSRGAAGYPESILDIKYEGGLYPKMPGHSLRKVNPRFIVVHHSATKEDRSFEDIVKIEKKERRNKKGPYKLDPSYHCVITKDGAYHNYCRWDSVGWHTARGLKISNNNSLGICFVGNFENRTNIKDYNNWDSNPRPSDEQIETASKIIALWRELYDIEENNIVGHRSVKRGHTVCPGNNFPLERLIARSTQELRQWQDDKKVAKKINKFKKLPFIFTDEA